MGGSAMLDVAIGTIFVFLAASLVVTAANELCASIFRWRAKNLAEGVRMLLDRGASVENEALLSERVYGHALIQSLVRKTGHWPSYIPSRTFAMALLAQADIAKSGHASIVELRTNVEKSKLPKPVKDVLLALLMEAEADLRRGVSPYAKLQEGIEIWFNCAMDRVSGWYKRKAQYLNFGFAVVLVAATNLDSIDVVRSLARDSSLRQAIAAQATALSERSRDQGAIDHDGKGRDSDESPVAGSVAAYQDLAVGIRAIDDLGIPMGWSREGKLRAPWQGAAALWWLHKVLGLLLTALAASLGAPFWFDMLNKIVSIRSSGKAPEEKPHSPKEVSQPVEPGQSPREAESAGKS
ncbi:MAG: hypothetical protein ABI193_26795 [Minicystis sp.]